MNSFSAGVSGDTFEAPARTGLDCRRAQICGDVEGFDSNWTTLPNNFSPQFYLARKAGGSLTMRVCRFPFIHVGAARRFPSSVVPRSPRIRNRGVRLHFVEDQDALRVGGNRVPNSSTLFFVRLPRLGADLDGQHAIVGCVNKRAGAVFPRPDSPTHESSRESRNRAGLGNNSDLRQVLHEFFRHGGDRLWIDRRGIFQDDRARLELHANPELFGSLQQRRAFSVFSIFSSSLLSSFSTVDEKIREKNRRKKFS